MFSDKEDYNALKKIEIQHFCINEVIKENKRDLTSSDYKKPISIQIKPEKRIKIPMKTNYDFPETYYLPPPPAPQIPEKGQICGSLTEKFSKFLNSRAKDTVKGFVVDFRAIYGCRVLSVDFGNRQKNGFEGVMTVIFEGAQEITGWVRLVDPKVMEINEGLVVVCRDISNC